MKLMTTHPLRLFALATLLPALPLLLGALSGGFMVWVGLACMTLLVAGLDQLVRRSTVETGDTGEFPSGDRLSLVLAGVHVVLLFAAVFALGRGASLSMLQHLGLFMGVGLWLGQIGNPNAHELIHRSDRTLFRTGKWLFISVLFGHHTSAHRKVHHTFVGTLDDPNTAQLGESFFGFAARAWPDGFVAGWEVEREALSRTARPGGILRHPYAVYVVGGIGFIGLAAVIGGFFGLLWYLALVIFVQAQLLLSDFVQHYGLERVRLDPEHLEPVGPQHSWNAPHWYSGAMMLNAPRHSDHHAHPARPYPELTLDADMPMLPRSLPVMGMIALYPPAWRRIMDKRARAWRRKAAPRRAAA